MSVTVFEVKASSLPLRTRIGVMKSAAIWATVTAAQHRVEIVTPPGIGSIFPNQIGLVVPGSRQWAWQAECWATHGEDDSHGET